VTQARDLGLQRLATTKQQIGWISVSNGRPVAVLFCAASPTTPTNTAAAISISFHALLLRTDSYPIVAMWWSPPYTPQHQHVRQDR